MKMKEELAMELLQMGKIIDAKQIEALPGHLGSSWSRRLRELRKDGLIDYEVSQKKGIYFIKGDYKHLQEWLNKEK